MSPIRRGKHAKRKILKRRPGTAGDLRRRRRLWSVSFSMHRWIRLFSAASVLLMAAITAVAVLATSHYNEYPVSVERDSIRVTDRGADHITLSWEATHNSAVYKVFVREYAEGQEEEAEAAEPDDSWRMLETSEAGIDVDGLEEDTTYSFIVRGDSEAHEGIATKPRNFRTKKAQTIQLERHITKFTCSSPFRIEAEAETGLSFESSDTSVAEVLESGEIQINGSGVTDISVRALETAQYDSYEDVVQLEVIDSYPADAGGANAKIIYKLDSENCEIVKTIEGSGGATVPQGLGYSGDKYIVAYGMGNPNRIISFDVDGDGKTVAVPRISLGHPNGFCYADETGLCYCVKGWSSKAYTYSPSEDKYGSVSLKYGCSGIAYDRKEKLLCTCSRTAMAAYDITDGYSVKYTTGVVKHSGYTYTQDCGAHGGLLFRCLSGSDKHGTNYIDIYDMKHGRYLGTLACDLSEVESCIVDSDGYLEILANNSSSRDYIWRTGLNVDTLSEGLE